MDVYARYGTHSSLVLEGGTRYCMHCTGTTVGRLNGLLPQIDLFDLRSNFCWTRQQSATLETLAIQIPTTSTDSHFSSPRSV